MLTRRNTDDPAQQGSQSEYYADSLLQKPGYFHSAFDNFAANFATPPASVALLDKQYAQSPEGQAMISTLSAVELENETPGLGWPQKATNTVAGMVGYALNPMTYLLGGVGGLAARGVIGAAAKIAPDAATVFMRTPIKDLLSQSIGKYVPSMVGKEGAEEPLSASLITDKTLHTFGTFAGFSVPQAIVDNYEQDTSHISWGGVAREAGEMGAFGIAIGSIPFTWGVLRGKINRGAGKEVGAEVTPDELSASLAKGHITQDEHDWYRDYQALRNDPSNEKLSEELKSKGSQIANENGHTASSVNNEALFEMLTPENMKNLQGVIADQLAGDVPERYKTALSDFIVHNRLDEIRQNPKDLDGVRGYVDFINQKLEAMPSKMAEADKILDDYLEKGIKVNMPLSQKELFKKLNGSELEPHIKHLPITIPENVSSHIKQLKEEKEPPQLLAPREELQQIKNALFGNKKTYYRGQRFDPEIYKTEQLNPHFDYHFGKGYWFTELEEHAKHYGKYIEKVKGDYNLYDTVNGLDEKANSLLAKIYKLPSHLLINPKYGKLRNAIITYVKKKNRVNLVKKLHDYLKSKGYEGMIRLEGAADSFGKRTPVEGHTGAKTEIMFFQKPKGNAPDKLIKNFEHSSAYHRLLDLSDLWANARTLLDRIHLEHEYNRQTAFRDLSAHILKVADSDMGRLAKPDTVIDYMKSRIEGKLQKIEPISETEKILSEQQKVPTDADTILNEQELQIQNTKAETAKEEFVNSTDKFKEFKQSESIFKNFISCVIGGLSGQGK